MNVALLATEATGAGGMTEAISSLMSAASSVMSTITGDTTLMVYFSAGIVFIAIGVVKRLRG